MRLHVELSKPELIIEDEIQPTRTHYGRCHKDKSTKTHYGRSHEAELQVTKTHYR